MQDKTIEEVEEEYWLELGKIVKTIKKEKAKKVLLQFPDGLKPYSTIIVDYLEKQLPKVEFLIWFGSCFGACDTPQVDKLGIGLIVQFGHSKNLSDFWGAQKFTKATEFLAQ